MAVAPSMDAAGDATRVPAHTSDLIELVSGVCQARRHNITDSETSWTAGQRCPCLDYAVWCYPSALTYLSLQLRKGCACLRVLPGGGCQHAFSTCVWTFALLPCMII